jgi:hypothetical protein
VDKLITYIVGLSSVVLAYYALKDRGVIAGWQSKPEQAEAEALEDTDPVDRWPGLGSGVL